MPYAVTHILIPVLLVSLFRDFYLKKKNKKHFPLHYALIAGLGGVLPDIDIVISIILNFAGVSGWNIHRTFTHSLFFPLLFFALFLILIPVHKKARICNLTRHNLKLSKISLMLSFGILVHIFLDSINWVFFLPEALQGLAMPTLDGILLVLWLIYLEFKHKISDFI